MRAALLHRPAAEQHGGAVGKYAPPAAPTSPLHWGLWRGQHGGTAGGSAQTDLPEEQASALLVLLGRVGHSPELLPAPALSTDVWGGARRNCLPIHVPVMRMGCTAATPVIMWEPPTAASTACTQLHGERCLEPAQRSRMLAPSWLPASSWLKWGFCWGPALWGPVCAALRAPPAALVPGRAGGQLCGDRRARAELGCAGAGAELWRCRGAGVVVGIGVAAGQAGGQCGCAVAGTAVLQQDVDALLAAGSPGIGQRGQAPSVPTLHIHSVLHGREAAGQWYLGTLCLGAGSTGALGKAGRGSWEGGQVSASGHGGEPT